MNAIRTWDDRRLLADRERPGESFAAFYRRHATGVLAFYARRGVDAPRAGELTAETFAAALEDRYRFRSDRPSAASWLHAIATCKLTFRHEREDPQATRLLGADPIPLDARDLADYAALPGSVHDVLDVQAYEQRQRRTHAA
ncbi:sigma factor [Patulibacter sp. S7RM1-6]